MKIPILSVFFIAFTLFIGISCKGPKSQFNIKGTISNADSSVLYLERRGLTETVLVDSVRLDANGNYTLKGEMPEYGSEFYVVKLNNQVINIAVDSVQTITINADKSSFATKYTVEGSKDTQEMKKVAFAQFELTNSLHELMMKYKSQKINTDRFNEQTTEAINKYKAMAKEVILSNYSGMASYYALFQRVDGLLIFDVYDKADLRLFQSAATSWKYKRPDSPRSKQLEQFVLEVLANIKQSENEESRLLEISKNSLVNTQEYYNITLPDKSGKHVSLSSLKGKLILLDFTSYAADFSSLHNIELNKIYDRYADKLLIYQVSLDNDEHIWRNVASNLPWITVRDVKSISSPLLVKFNIKGLPTTFLIDKEGNISKRILTSDNIDAEIKKIL